jgi:hypothetical protein
MTRSGNNNLVEVYVTGSGWNTTVNITVSLEADNSALEDSNNDNTVKIYIGEVERVNMGDSTFAVVGRMKANDTANVSRS